MTGVSIQLMPRVRDQSVPRIQAACDEDQGLKHITHITHSILIFILRGKLYQYLCFSREENEARNSLAQCHRASNWKCQETGLNQCFEALFSAFPSFLSEWRATKNWFKLVSGEGHGAKSEYHCITLGSP